MQPMPRGMFPNDQGAVLILAAVLPLFFFSASFAHATIPSLSLPLPPEQEEEKTVHLHWIAKLRAANAKSRGACAVQRPSSAAAVGRTAV